MSGKLKVTLIRSVAGTTERQRATVRALGLHKTNSSNVLPDCPQTQGMIKAVGHMLAVEKVG